MEVEFETNDADLAAFQKAANPHAWWMEYVAFLGLYLFYSGPAFLPYFVSGRPIAGGIFFAIFSAFWIWAIIYSKRQERKKFVTGSPVRIRLDPRGVIEREEHATTWVAWPLFEKVNTFPGFVQFLLKTKLHVTIPTRAFASEEEQTRFVELAQQYLSAAEDPVAESFPRPDEEYYPTWVGGITQSIDFRNDADELAFVNSNGVPPTKRPNIYLSTLHSLLWLTGAFLVLGFGAVTPSTDEVDVSLLMYFASIVWFIASLIGTGTALRWYNRSQIPAIFLTPRRLTMAAKGYVVQTSLVMHCGDWKNLMQVEQNVEFLAFKTHSQQHTCILPKKAFPTPQLAQEFADEAQLYWQDAQQPDEAEVASDVITAELADGDNPFRSPHA